jgi:L-threonylcarbamoyladenylate synthase
MRNTCSSLDEAARVLRGGGIVLYPTDTLLGLGACIRDEAAVAALFRLKDRSRAQAVSVAFSSTEELEPWVEMSDVSRAWVRRNLPGPYTVILRASPLSMRDLPEGMVSEGEAIGIRIPDHDIARDLARRVGPITATSANPHGQSPCRTVREAKETFGEGIDAYLPASPPPSGNPSVLVDLSGQRARVLSRERA